MKRFFFLFCFNVISFFPLLVYAQDDWVLYYNKGLNFYNNGDFRSAIEELNLAIHANPSYARAYALRGKVKVLLYQNESATHDYEKAFELNAEYFHTNEGRAPIKSLMEDYKDVINKYAYGIYGNTIKDSVVRINKMTYQKDDKIGLLEQVHEKMNAGRYKEVNQALREFIVSDTTNTYAYYLLGCLSEYQKDYKAALVYYSQNIKLDPLFYLHYYKRALAYYKLEQYDAALMDFIEVERLNPDFDLLYYNRAVIYKKQKRWQAALDDLNHALVLNKDFPEAYFNRAFVKKELVDYKGALEDYGLYLSRHPDDALAYNNRANINLLMGNYQQAQRDYDKAVALSPQLSVAYLNRGIGNIMLGSKDEACRDFTTSSMMGNAKAKKKIQLYCH